MSTVGQEKSRSRWSAPSGTPLLIASFCLCLVFFVCNPSARALDPDKKISQFGHTAWRIRDGYFTGLPYAITQTTDGYLWIGTESGLWRFDGLRFVYWTPPAGKALLGSAVLALRGTRDGSLWIGTSGGLSRWKDQELTNYADATGAVFTILERADGDIWFMRHQIFSDAPPLCHVIGQKSRCYGEAEGFPFRASLPLVEGPSGELLAGTTKGVARWKPGAMSFYGPPALKDNQSDGVTAIVRAQENSWWVGIAATGPGLGLEQLINGAWKPFVAPGFDGSKIVVNALLLDRHNTLWVGTETQGVFRIRGDHVDHFGTEDGLSSDFIVGTGLFEDREGNVLVVTSRGLDSFRDMPVTVFTKREGLATDEVDGVHASRDGTVWVGGPGSLDAILPDGEFSVRAQRHPAGSQVTALLEDRAGRLWFGIDNSLVVRENGNFRPVRGLGGKPVGFVGAMTQDIDGDVWAETVGSPRKLLHIRDFQVLQEFPEPQMPVARRIAADPNGGVWLGLGTGDLARYAYGKLDVFRFTENTAPAVDLMVTDIAVAPDGSVLGATRHGVNAWKNGRQQRLTMRNGLPCDGVEGILIDNSGSVWMNAQCGLLTIDRSEMERWWNQPEAALKVRAFDAIDGVQPGHSAFNPSAKSPDGKLWFASGTSLQMVDPNRIGQRARAAQVLIEDIVANRKSYAIADSVSLPPATRDLEIVYTAPNFASPQKVLFRYRLEGHDAGWQDADTRRQAFYSDLPPGNYRFRVEACNNCGSGGTWNEAGTSVDFRILPAWYQTVWFRGSIVIGVALLLWLMHLLRVRSVSRVIHARAEERLAERTRMARELHDTFVQTVQGSKLVAEDALEKPSDPEGMRHALKQVSEWLDRATQEARAALSSLRESATEGNDLAESFQRVLQSGILGDSVAVNFSVVGEPREIHPIVRDEIFRIGYEAIQNAGRHSRASRLDVELRYGRELTLRIRDNGVGIDPEVLGRGKEGHFGLEGMRERAGRIGGKLTLISTVNAGTEVRLVVVEGSVYRAGRKRFVEEAIASIKEALRHKEV